MFEKLSLATIIIVLNGREEGLSWCSMGEKRHLQVEYQLNAAVRAVALDAREYLHTLASDTHPLGALEGPAVELQEARNDV